MRELDNRNPAVHGGSIKKIKYKIRELRAARGFHKQLEFCAACGIKQCSMSRYENGKGNPPIQTLRKIADVLKCDVRDLFEEVEEAQ